MYLPELFCAQKHDLCIRLNTLGGAPPGWDSGQKKHLRLHTDAWGTWDSPPRKRFRSLAGEHENASHSHMSRRVEKA